MTAILCPLAWSPTFAWHPDRGGASRPQELDGLGRVLPPRSSGEESNFGGTRNLARRSHDRTERFEVCPEDEVECLT